MNKVGFRYGVLCGSLKEQAKEQGYKLEDCERFEKIRDAINLCGFHVATSNQVDSMFKKLHKEVVKNLIKIKE